MGIYIKGMEMPKDGELLCINIYPDGKVCINLDLDSKQIATAVSVPLHGRLIDADKLGIQDAEKQAYEAYLQEKGEDFIEEPLLEYLRGRSDGLTEASGYVRFAPTIIPASEEDE